MWKKHGRVWQYEFTEKNIYLPIIGETEVIRAVANIIFFKL